MTDPLEALLVNVDTPPSAAILRAIEAAKGLNDAEREKLRRAAAETVRAAHASGYEQGRGEQMELDCAAMCIHCAVGQPVKFEYASFWHESGLCFADDIRRAWHNAAPAQPVAQPQSAPPASASGDE